MKLTLLILVVSISIFCNNAEKNTSEKPSSELDTTSSYYYQKTAKWYDTIHKYSYIVSSVGIREWNYQIGTGFFFKTNDALYFVSNKHVLTNVDPVKRSKITYDTMVVQVFDRFNNPVGIMMDMREINKKIRPFHSMTEPDIIFVRINNVPKEAIIYSVEQFPIVETKQIESLSEAASWGYKGSMGIYNTYDDLVAVLNQRPNLSTLLFSHAGGYLQKEKVHNKTSFVYLTVTGEFVKGCSGSPIFCNVNGRVMLCGVAFAGMTNDAQQKLVYGVQPYFILKALSDAEKEK